LKIKLKGNFIFLNEKLYILHSDIRSKSQTFHKIHHLKWKILHVLPLAFNAKDILFLSLKATEQQIFNGEFRL